MTTDRAWAAEPHRDRDRAVELFKASQKAYESAEFDRASVLLEEAYALDPNPILLYNLARAREASKDLTGALEGYRQYLRQTSGTDDRAEVEARIEGIERHLEARAEWANRLEAAEKAHERALLKAQTARAEAEVRAVLAQDGQSRLGPLLVTGAGLAGLATGVVLSVVAHGRNDDARAATEERRAAALADEADRLALGANIAYAAGGALAIGGLVWGLVQEATRRQDRSGDTALLIGPKGLILRGRF